MSLKCIDREGLERHYQTGSPTLAFGQLENLFFFHANHMLGTLDFSDSEHWAPLIMIKLVVDGDERFT